VSARQLNTPWGIIVLMIPNVTVTELKRAMDAGAARVVDVREDWEYSEAHVPGSTLVPMSSVPERTEVFTGDGPTFVICRSGNRSGHVVAWLVSQGIDVINVAGGIIEWQQQGYPVNTGGQQ
jgi:rhodanese-related sulfurtransferase